MDADTVLGAVNVGLLLIVYMYVQRREDMTRAKIEEQDKRIHDVETNYNAKFTAMHDKMTETKEILVEKLTELEGNMRDSNHSLRDAVTKALHDLEAKIKAA